MTDQNAPDETQIDVSGFINVNTNKFICQFVHSDHVGGKLFMRVCKRCGDLVCVKVMTDSYALGSVETQFVYQTTVQVSIQTGYNVKSIYF